MLGLAGLIVLLGYQNIYFGLDQLQSGNNSYFSLLIPGRFVPNVPKDGATSSSSAAAAAAATQKTVNALNSIGANPGPTGLAAAAAALKNGLSTFLSPGAATSTQSGGLGVPGVPGR